MIKKARFINGASYVSQAKMTQNLVERVKSCGVSLASAVMVGGLGFAGVDLCKLVPYRATYDWDFGNVAGVLGASLIAGIFGYNKPDAVLNAGKKFFGGIANLCDKIFRGKHVGSEDDVKETRSAVGCSRIAGAVLMLGGLSGMVAANKQGLMPREVSDTFGFKTIDNLIAAYSTRKPIYLPLDRNIHFLKNYVFNDVLDGFPVPSDDLVSVNSDGSVDVSAFEKWHLENYGGIPDEMHNANGPFNARWDFRGFVYSKPLFRFFDFNKRDSSFFVLNGEVIDYVFRDLEMQNMNHPDSKVINGIFAINEKIYCYAITLPQKNFAQNLVRIYFPNVFTKKINSEKLIIYEYGDSTPLFGTPIKDVSIEINELLIEHDGAVYLSYDKKIKKTNKITNIYHNNINGEIVGFLNYIR